MRKVLVFGILLTLVLSASVFAATFKDMASNHWAAPSVSKMVKIGVTKGFPDGTFRGKENLNRYQTVVFLDKVVTYLESKIGAGSSTPVVAAGSAGVSGTMFVSYNKNVSNSGITNNFNVNRAYLNVARGLDGNTEAKVTLDTAGLGTNTFVKNAYVTLKGLGSGLIPGVTASTTVGIQPTYWIGYADSILGIRVVSRGIVETEMGEASADAGLGFAGTMMIPYLPKMNYVGTVMNGGGFTVAEANAGKDIAGRVDMVAYPGVTVALGGQIENVTAGSTGNKMVNLLGAYAGTQGKVMAEIAYGKGASAYSVAGTYDLVNMWDALANYGALARVDIVDPSRTTASDGHTRIIVGGTYDWSKAVTLVLDATSTTYAAASPNALAGLTATSAALRAQINL